MAPFGTIYSYPGNFRVQRAQIAGEFNGLEVVLAPDFEMRKTNTTPEFLAKFPLGKVPAFEGADGFCLSEGAAIAQYVAASGPKAAQLLGTADVKTQALIAQWVAFADAELTNNALGAAMMTLYKFRPFDQAAYDTSANGMLRALKRLEVALGGSQQYLVGSTVTLADIMVFGPLAFASKFLIDDAMRDEVPTVAKYLDALAALPEFAKVCGTLEKVQTRITA
ncbi:glutathione S-transferase [Microdochium trichocladiopsis]|uniref:Glutathione S-transferase n=1 Tax=Microdochium trichocladiopsis TaxID=1682393 RepID=A0A9P8Y170_9PEZI|nr:glutathione S-transferase [Microdochium trichocladiopsis]KAH7026615.1 glutathione S-transferase [Microdochium trichocladiopsis]